MIDESIDRYLSAMYRYGTLYQIGWIMNIGNESKERKEGEGSFMIVCVYVCDVMWWCYIIIHQSFHHRHNRSMNA